MHIAYDYSKKPFGDWDSFRIVPLFPVNELPAKPEKQPSEEIDLGALRTERSVSRIRLPENFSADLPDAVHVKTPFATYDKTYKLEGGALIAEKTLVVLQSKLPAASWQQYQKFAKDISLGEESWVQLTKSAVAGKGSYPKVARGNPEAAKLLADAINFERANNWAAALKKLDEAKAIEPEQPFLWSNYAFVEMLQQKTKEAKKHFRHELDLHPDESYVVYLYGGLLHRNREDAAARTLLSAFLKDHPSDRQNALLLAAIQAESNLPDAIATLRETNEALPEDLTVWNTLAGYLIRDHQNAEAAALARKHLENAEDPNLLNDAAYLLAEANVDLPRAEAKARKALEMLNGETAGASISEANARSFARTNLLVATWDTLGFILLEENKLGEARDYLEAAWRNDPNREVGEHYALMQEALGDSTSALRAYELARSFRASADLTQRIDANIERLKKAGIASSVTDTGATQILQQERSFKLKFKSPCHSYCSATFRLQLASDSSLTAMRVSGEPELETATGLIKQMTLPHLVPTNSAVHILRDAILSCSAGATTCDFVLMPLGNINAERVE
jgi:predicted Zn-dependent protease